MTHLSVKHENTICSNSTGLVSPVLSLRLSTEKSVIKTVRYRDKMFPFN